MLRTKRLGIVTSLAVAGTVVGCAALEDQELASSSESAQRESPIAAWVGKVVKVADLPSKAAPIAFVKAPSRAIVAFNTNENPAGGVAKVVSVDGAGGTETLKTFSFPEALLNDHRIELDTWSAFQLGTSWWATDGTVSGTKDVAFNPTSSVLLFEDRVLDGKSLYGRGPSPTVLDVRDRVTLIPCGTRLYGFQQVDEPHLHLRLDLLNERGESVKELLPDHFVRMEGLREGLAPARTWQGSTLSCLDGKLYVETYDQLVRAGEESGHAWWRVTDSAVPFAGLPSILAGTTALRFDSTGLVRITETGTVPLKEIAPAQSPTFWASSSSFAYFRTCPESSRCEIWRTDGTVDGTARIDDDKLEGTVDVASVGDQTFFRVDRPGASEVWTTNGTAGIVKLPLPPEPARADSMNSLSPSTRRLVVDGPNVWFLRRSAPDVYAVFRIETPEAPAPDAGPSVRPVTPSPGSQRPPYTAPPAPTPSGAPKAAPSASSSGCAAGPRTSGEPQALGALGLLFALVLRRRRSNT